MDERELFLRTLDDLEEKAVGTDEYEATRAAGLLRQLLMDGGALVHRVNTDHRLKLSFEVADHPRFDAAVAQDRPVFRLVLDGLYPPSSLPGSRVQELNIDGWLAFAAGEFRGTEFSVRDVIRYMSHVAGGVHTGKPKSEVDRHFKAIDGVVQINGLSGVARTVKGIMRVTLAGLAPLKEAVKASTP